MDLQSFVEANLKYDFYRLQQDQDLSSQIQEILINQGFLYPNVEDVFDNVNLNEWHTFSASCCNLIRFKQFLSRSAS